MTFLPPAPAQALTDGDPAWLLAEMTGVTTPDAEEALLDLTGGDPSSLLEGLDEAEAEELLELIADLAGMGMNTPIGTRTVGIAEPAFRKMARDLEERMHDHLWYGQIFLDVTYATVEKNPGEVVGLGGGGDSAIWSGHYLAAEAFRYALARERKNRARNHGQAVVWSHEMRRAKERIDALVAGAHRNINISKNWKAKGAFSPAFDAEAGILFRNSFPEGVPSWQQNQGPNRHEFTFGPIPWDDGQNYFCQGTFTRDQYTGCVLGLLATLDLVGPDDPALQAVARDDLMVMAEYLVRHEWSVIRPETSITDPTPAVQPLINGVRWCNFMAHSARHAARSAGSLEEQAKWEAIWTETFATLGPFILVEDLNDIQNPSQSYYRFNLAHGQYFNLIRHEPDPAVREYFRESLAMIDATTRDDGNSHFETITYALSGQAERLDLAVTHLREWLEYYARWSEGICMSCRCDIDLECVPRDEVTFTVTVPLSEAAQREDGLLVVHRKETVGETLALEASVILSDTLVVEASGSMNGTPAATAASVEGSGVVIEITKPGTSAEKRSALLRIADERTPQDFLWQRSPYNGSGSLDREARPTERNAGVDFLLPYYMLRYYTNVAPPALSPWAEWPVQSR